jgi:predicted naringenin-chalcone synthase
MLLSGQVPAAISDALTAHVGSILDNAPVESIESATVMFVLESLLRSAPKGASGCAMSFGPGLVAETMRFRAVG